MVKKSFLNWNGNGRRRMGMLIEEGE